MSEGLTKKALEVADFLEANEEALAAFDRKTRGYGKYSLVNRILIDMQMPEATDVATDKGWQARGRQVRKGERSIKINAPRGRKQDQGQEQGAAQPEEREPATAQQQDEAQQGGRRKFRQMAVFDVSQTDQAQDQPDDQHQAA